MDPLFLAYLSLTAALVITPGATVAVVVRNTLSGGYRGGLSAALGAALGNSIHAVAAGLGLAVLVSRSPLLLALIQLTGGGYLLWLGLKSARRILDHDALPVSGVILSGAGAHVHHLAWREGLVVNLLNPPIITFYLAVVPSFMPPSAPQAHYLQLASTHVGMAFAVHNVWALSLDRLRPLLERPAARVALEGLTAGALFLIATRVLTAAWAGL